MNQFRLELGKCRIAWVVALSQMVLLTIPMSVSGWGSAGHRLMTADVVDRLPDELQFFYQQNLPQLADAAVAPIEEWPRDSKLRRRHQWSHVALDAATLDDKSPPNRESRLAASRNFPRHERQIKRVYRRHGVSRGGRLPWSVADQYSALVAAFQSGDTDQLTSATGTLIYFAAETAFPLSVSVDRASDRIANPSWDHIRDFEPAYAHRDPAARIGNEYIRRARVALLNGLSSERPESSQSNAAFVGDVLEQSLEQCIFALGQTDEWLDQDRMLCEAARINSPESMLERAREYYQTLDDQFQQQVAGRMSAGSRFASNLIERAWREAGRPDLGRFAFTPPSVATSLNDGSMSNDVPPAGPDFHRIVASKLSRVFHRASCPFAKKISPDNIESFPSETAAEASGRRWCRVCGPADTSQSVASDQD